MSYDLHITRKPDWAEAEGPTIGEDEWRAVVAADPELRFDETPAVAVAPDGSVISAPAGLRCEWKGPGGQTAWFHYARGEVFARNPDEETTGKLVQLSTLLAARVQGDEGETYPLKPAQAPLKPDQPAGRPWWRRLWSR